MQVVFTVRDLARERAAWFADPDGNVVAVAEPARVAAAIE